MKTLLPVLLCCVALAAHAEEKSPPAGERIKSDAKGFGSSVAKATKDVGKQIGAGTKKAVTSIKTIGKTDVKQGTRGDGSAKRRNQKMDTEKAGRK
ncbi:MAG: hypothetical protein ACT4PQ_11850 [Betaproteobacteria bacterium]